MGIGGLEDRVRQVVNAIIDPETGMTFGEMRVIKDLREEDPGVVTIEFKPSSPFCPIALKLALDIKDAALKVGGVNRAVVHCLDHIMQTTIDKTVNEAEVGSKSERGR
jgi:metal-sulfur cluster biosynthetic enzyme